MSSEALEAMSQFGAAGSETTSDIGRRIDNITQALQALGHTDEEIMLAVRIEYRKAELSDSWQEEVRLENSIEGIKEWAGRKFMELDIPEDMAVDEFEVTVRAYGSWAKFPYKFITRHLMTILRESPSRVVSTEGPGSHGPGSHVSSRRPREPSVLPSTPERAQRPRVGAAPPMSPGPQRRLNSA